MAEDDDAGLRVGGGGRFYAGTIKKLFAGRGMGVVRSATGREIPFSAQHVILSGSVRRFDELREGMTVGFDVGWTSGGLRVTVLHTPSDAAGT
jgi:hypothetical protein